MPHPLEAYRDRIDALIGPLEEIEAKLVELVGELNLSHTPAVDYAALYYIGVTSAKDDLSSLVADIDGYEEEPEEQEPEEEAEEEEDNEEEDDEDEDA